MKYERRKGKAWWKSKTLWLNAVLAAGTVIEANLGTIQALLGPTYYLAIIGATAGLNAALRFVTSQQIGKE